ncbi:MAG: hypothetical protein EZS28_038348, partial [Streblomastix strix]
IAKVLSSVHRTLIDACRTLVVWTTMIIVNLIAKDPWGEQWLKFSFIEIIGFGFLAGGTLVYNRVFKPDVIVQWCFRRGNRRRAIVEEETQGLVQRLNQDEQNNNETLESQLPINNAGNQYENIGFNE